MDIYSIIERVRPHWIAIAFGLAGLLFVIYGFFALSMPKDEKKDIVFESSEHNSDPGFAQAKKTEKKITIDIEGGVIKPGVYSLAEHSRIQDALVAAGGMSPQADYAVVSKMLNLAAKLTDGAKIYIPLQGDPTDSSPLRPADFAGQAGQGVLGLQTININSASAKELDSLAGIGEVTAQKIISNRPYGAIDELVTKKVVGKKVFDQIKEKISVY